MARLSWHWRLIARPRESSHRYLVQCERKKAESPQKYASMYKCLSSFSAAVIITHRDQGDLEQEDLESAVVKEGTAASGTRGRGAERSRPQPQT